MVTTAPTISHTAQRRAASGSLLGLKAPAKPQATQRYSGQGRERTRLVATVPAFLDRAILRFIRRLPVSSIVVCGATALDRVGCRAGVGDHAGDHLPQRPCAVVAALQRTAETQAGWIGSANTLVKRRLSLSLLGVKCSLRSRQMWASTTGRDWGLFRPLMDSNHRPTLRRQLLYPAELREQASHLGSCFRKAGS